MKKLIILALCTILILCTFISCDSNVKKTISCYTVIQFDKTLYSMKSGSTWFNSIASETGLQKEQITSVSFVSTFPGGNLMSSATDLTEKNTGNVIGCLSGTDLFIVGEYIFGNNDCSHMFDGFSSLASIDFNKFDISDVTDVKEMFHGTENLDSIVIKNQFQTVCKELNDESKEYLADQLLYFTYNNGKYLRDYQLCNLASNIPEPLKNLISHIVFTQTVPSGEDYYVSPTDLSIEQKGQITGYLRLEGTDIKMYIVGKRILGHPDLTCSGMFTSFTSLKSVDFGNNFDTSRVTNMDYMFHNCSNLTTITNLNKLNKERNTEICNMFEGCKKLESVDLGKNFVTSKITNIKNLFKGCENLKSITGFNSFDTSSVISMASMFENCKELKSLDLSSFDTSNVQYMSLMFKECNKLETINGLNLFDTSALQYMTCMFQGCRELKSIDLSSFNTSNVKKMEHMFHDCFKLSSITFGSNFKTSEVTTMKYMFYYCTSLTNLDLSAWDTQKVTDMSYMFYKCSSLPSLDLSSFNTLKVTDMKQMFLGSNSLSILDISNFDITTTGTDRSSVPNTENMFVYVPNSCFIYVSSPSDWSSFTGKNFQTKT